MAASYPTSVKAFTTKAAAQTVQPAHINDLQDEVTAVESALLSGGLAHAVTITAGAGGAALTVPATGRLYLDGGSNTFIVEGSSDVVTIYAGGSAIFSVIKPTGDGYVSVTGGYAMTTWPTVAGSANAILADGQVLKIATSLRRHKTEIQTVPAAEAARVITGLNPVTFRSRLPEDNRVWPGLIAEEVEPVEPALCVYDPAGALQSVAYDRVPTYLVAVVQDLLARVASLEAQVTTLKGK